LPRGGLSMVSSAPVRLRRTLDAALTLDHTSSGAADALSLKPEPVL
jgi:hypothetical protein